MAAAHQRQQSDLGGIINQQSHIAHCLQNKFQQDRLNSRSANRVLNKQKLEAPAALKQAPGGDQSLSGSSRGFQMSSRTKQRQQQNQMLNMQKQFMMANIGINNSPNLATDKEGDAQYVDYPCQHEPKGVPANEKSAASARNEGEIDNAAAYINRNATG